MNKHELEELARRLEQHADYRVLRRLTSRRRYRPDPEDRSMLRKGLFLDVETTGLDHHSDAIIELAMVPFEFTTDGLVCSVGDGYDAYDDPGQPIPEAITKLTGIRDQDVAGQHIDADEVARLVEPAQLIVAHNAGFDRRFVEARFEFFTQKAWACSMREIPWRDEDMESAKQEFIAYRFGVFYDGHRAGEDCIAGIHLLAQTLPVSGRPVLATLLDSARLTTYRLWAVSAPFEARSLLKSRGYRWNAGDDGRAKAWYLDCDQQRCAEEKEFLVSEIYKRDIDLPIDKITCFERYSDRI
ncbi:MAG: 3'-5' exonuclease [Gammaproteobacteria bacterium]|nr:3'-5' exonuclease [Gammaproteobacteria bacterium]